MNEVASNDPWIKSLVTHHQTCEFEDNFLCLCYNAPQIDEDTLQPHIDEYILQHNTTALKPIPFVVDGSKKCLSGKKYSEKLEQKLAKLQGQREQKTGKNMLQGFQEKKELYLKELLQGLNVTMETISSDNPRFLDKLYNTNSVYRHMNPQQALDSSEKEPFAKYDHLALQDNQERVNKDIT